MTDQPQQTEQTIIENRFGTVTNKRVIYFCAKGWFGGGAREDIPLQHVTSVRSDITRGFINGMLGLVLLFSGFGMLVTVLSQGFLGFLLISVPAILLLGLGVLFLWGSPIVVVNTAGRDINAAKGLPWQRSEANAFVEALRAQLFKP